MLLNFLGWLMLTVYLCYEYRRASALFRCPPYLGQGSLSSARGNLIITSHCLSEVMSHDSGSLFHLLCQFWFLFSAYSISGQEAWQLLLLVPFCLHLTAHQVDSDANFFRKDEDFLGAKSKLTSPKEKGTMQKSQLNPVIWGKDSCLLSAGKTFKFPKTGTAGTTSPPVGDLSFVEFLSLSPLLHPSVLFLFSS